MRPVFRGNSPYDNIKNYSEAMPYLKERLGAYCSYCEMKLDNAPEVEHVCSKSNGGSTTDWNNLLLACKQCNTRKSNKTNMGNLNNYLWPDADNTAIAFTYTNGVVNVNVSVLMDMDPSGEILHKAKALYALVGLGHKTYAKFPTDSRYQLRRQHYNTALRLLSEWKLIKGENSKGTKIYTGFIDIITGYVKDVGFFSVWLEVFKDKPEVLSTLMNALPGTNLDCYEKGIPKKIIISNSLKRNNDT